MCGADLSFALLADHNVSFVRVLCAGEEQQGDRSDLPAEGAAAGAGAGGGLAQDHQGHAGRQEQDQSDHRGRQVRVHEG